MNPTMLTASLVWTTAGWTMLHLVWVGALIGLVAAISRRLFQSAGPEVRHATALACMLVLAGSPVVIFLRVFEPASPSKEAPFAAIGPEKRGSGGLSRFPESVMPARPGLHDLALIRPESTSRWKLDSLIPFLPAFWLAGSLSTLFLLITGLIGVAQLRRTSRIIETGEIAERLRTLADSLRIARRVGVGICDRLAAPVLIGIVRPLILLPPAALCGWNIEQLEIVLLHELAHLRRCDNLINLMQRVVESLLFFHPVV
jgi:BlaR1 peptidase M56